MVKTPPFHGGNTGSNPVGVIKIIKKIKKSLEKEIEYDKIILVLNKSSDDGKEDTPVPIPNTEVKLFSADGSKGLPLVRVGRC